MNPSQSSISSSGEQRGAIPRAIPTNEIRAALANRRFFWTVEFIPSAQKNFRADLTSLEEIASAVRDTSDIAGFSITDRVISDRDPDPVAAAAHLLARTGKQPLIHFSGKGRELDDLRGVLKRIDDNGLENLLIISGDRLKEEPKEGRPRYLESVPAIHAARQSNPALLLAGAFNPFKYREEDAMAQYLKLGKKMRAGADVIITQIGFDPIKYEEAIYWINARTRGIPLVANLMPISAARARYVRTNQLPGVTITDSFLALLEAEERLMPDKGASRGLRRLALQILGVRYLGYAGVQLTGVHSQARLRALGNEVDLLAQVCADRMTWQKAWDESLTMPEGGRANVVPKNTPWYLVDGPKTSAKAKEIAKNAFMTWVHDIMFDGKIVAPLIARVIGGVRRHSMADRLLARVELNVKAPLFGCETCGICRLAATQYVCPETCPKGLANGACGGTSDNLCEFRDRECIHSVRYRIARATGHLEDMDAWIVPAVLPEIRNTSSWPAYFRGERAKMEPAKPRADLPGVNGRADNVLASSPEPRPFA